MKRRPWTEVEIELLRRNYADSLTADIATAIGRNVLHVYSKATKLGLRKSAAFQASDQSGRLLKGGLLGKAHQFKPGIVPWNKGQHHPARGRAVETQFKPGHRPHTWVPVGSHRVNSDGFVEFKFADEPGRYDKRWIPVHRKVWIEAHGPIPAGHVVAFKPGRRTTDPALITLDALELLTLAQNLKRNSLHRYPPEIVKVIQLRGVLNRRITRLARAETEAEPTTPAGASTE